MNENELLEKEDLREKLVSRTEVLDKVGQLLLLPNTEFATTKQVADYYKVGTTIIRKVVERNNNELNEDGYKVWKAKDFNSDDLSQLKVNINRGNFEVKFNENTIEKFSPRGVALFPKRAILRVGMLLRDSEVAKEVRTRLLDIVQDTEKESPKIVKNIVNEISEEKQLLLDKAEAEYQGKYDEVSVYNAKLFALKNKRINELEKVNNEITTHSLSIIESRSVINRIVRTIAMKKYNSMFGKAWNELYTKMNYILHINIKARNREKGEKYLDTLTEEEMYKVEKITRSWAIKENIDLEELLKIA